MEQRSSEVKNMIPEKFFEFGQVENYQSSNTPFQMLLTVAHDQITSVQTDEIENICVIMEKAPFFNTTFRNLSAHL